MANQQSVIAKTATILNGASLSNEINIEGYNIVGFIMPATWTAASLSFAAAIDTGGTFVPITDDAAAEVTFTVAAAKAVGCRADKASALAPWRFIKLQSGTSGATVNQGADRVITLILKKA